MTFCLGAWTLLQIRVGFNLNWLRTIAVSGIWDQDTEAVHNFKPDPGKGSNDPSVACCGILWAQDTNHRNTRIDILVPRSNIMGIPEIMVCRILVFMWSFWAPESHINNGRLYVRVRRLVSHGGLLANIM